MPLVSRSKILPLLPILFFFVALAAKAETREIDLATEELEAWEAFLSEVGLAEPTEIPQADLRLSTLIRDESIRFFILGGYTNNSLLSGRRVPASFFGGGAEAFVWQTDGLHFFTIWALAERRRFASDEDLEDEWTAALHIRYEHALPLGGWILEGGVSATRQAFDAADTALPGEATVDFLGVVMPRAAFTWKRVFGFGQELEIGLASEHALYQEIDYNNSQNGFLLRLRTPILPQTTAAAGWAVRDIVFDDEPPRSVIGFPLSSERLRFVRYEADFLLQHNRTWVAEHVWQLRFFGSWTQANSSPWHGFRRNGVEFRGRSTLARWRLIYRGSVSDVAYRERRAGVGSEDRLQQRRHAGALALERTIGSWQIRGELEHIRFSSNDPGSSYRAQQYTATLAREF